MVDETLTAAERIQKQIDALLAKKAEALEAEALCAASKGLVDAISTDKVAADSTVATAILALVKAKGVNMDGKGIWIVPSADKVLVSVLMAQDGLPKGAKSPSANGKTANGNGTSKEADYNGGDGYQYRLVDGRGPFPTVQAALDAMGVPAEGRPAHNRWDRLSEEWKKKILREAKPATDKAPEPAKS